MKSNLLKSLIVLNGKTIPRVANDIKISKTAMYRKINGETEFTRKEISELIGILNIKPLEAIDIFFDIKVS